MNAFGELVGTPLGAFLGPKPLVNFFEFLNHGNVGMQPFMEHLRFKIPTTIYIVRISTQPNNMISGALMVAGDTQVDIAVKKVPEVEIAVKKVPDPTSIDVVLDVALEGDEEDTIHRRLACVIC